MLDQSTDSQRFKILAQAPNEEELQAIMDAAVKETGAKFYYGWTNPDEQNFALSVEHGASIGGACEWRMFSGDGKEALELWFIVTDDANCIRDLIREAATTRNFGLQPQAKSSFPSASGGKKNILKARAPERDVANSTFTNLSIDETLELLPKEETLKGNLKLVHITNLLQSIGMGGMSGRLHIQRHASNFANIFFQNGVPVHAEGTKGIGEDCLLQVICWTEGDFLFEPKLKTDEVTIDRSLEFLILEGCKLLDNTNHLMKAGVRMTSVFYQTNEDLSEREFEEAMKTGEPLDMTVLKDFYVAVDGHSSLDDIVNELDLPRSRWVPVVANLMRVNVIEIAVPSAQSSQLVHPKDIDSRLVESVRQGMIAPDSGIFSYAAFLFLLGVQIKCSSLPLSVWVMDIAPVKTASARGKTVLSAQQIQELSVKIDKLTSSRNILAHYEDGQLAVILLGMRAAKAARIADRLVKALATSGFETGSDKVFASIGVASHPDDAQDLGSLLGEAERAKTQAAKAGSCVCMAAGDDSE